MHWQQQVHQFIEIVYAKYEQGTEGLTVSTSGIFCAFLSLTVNMTILKDKQRTLQFKDDESTDTNKNDSFQFV